MSGYDPGTVDLTVRAERVPNLQRAAGQDKRSGVEYAEDLAAETRRSLARSPSWRAGQPLTDGQRWPSLTVGDLGGGRNLDSRKHRRLDRAGTVRWGQ